ncbi:heterokaryon incompatibility protein-domain-containing protein [Phaeosphaeria sp. MPI-PUGE-AT-0046c]|nr:heterokaryon incompatibility protein-domain-containing protein [Phaeosphaeria sp. MPI-PUGE-AT-0046c]
MPLECSNMTLCQSCRNIRFTNLNRSTHPTSYLRSQFPRSSFAVLQASAKALFESANNGCPLCAKFWARLSWQGARTTELMTTLTDGRWPDEKDGEENPRVILSCQYKEDESDWLFKENAYISCGKWGNSCDPRLPVSNPMRELFARADGSKPLFGTAENEITEEIDDHTGSKVNLELAKIWLQECQLTHDKCAASQPRKAHSNLPSRLIDILDPEKPYILEVEEHLDHDDYLTLSYCWGHGKRLLNTLHSKESFQQGLPMDDRLPLTFREAFQVTRALGYQYIWIDALCILQDDPLDLQKEMTKMGDIYQNSAITIFAGNGLSVQAGLFASRAGPSFKPSSVSIQTKDCDNDTIKQHEVCFISETYEFEDPLMTRAWILQEQVLAHRQLIFTPREIRWTCKSKQWSESRPYHLESRRGKLVSGKMPPPTVAPIRSLFASLSMKAPTTAASPVSTYHFHAWYQTAAAYNPRNLTVASDKMPAISAIARSIHLRYGCEYGAGLFKEDLPFGLCWTTDRDEADADESFNPTDKFSRASQQDYVAPSWSWASVRNTRLIWKGDGRKDTAPEEGIKVLDWQFTYAPGAMIPFGQITSGILTVSGYLRQYLLMPHFGEEKWHRNVRRIWGAWAIESPDPSTASIKDLVALDEVSFYKDLKKRFEGLESTVEAFKASPGEYVARALPVSTIVTFVSKEPRLRYFHSVILVPHDLAKCEYRRIGLLMGSTETYDQWDSTSTLYPRQTVKII